MSLRKVEFFYDVVSPWGWLAFETILRFEKEWKIQLEFKPLLLGGVMNLTGNRPPISVPAKGKHMMDDLQRSSRYFGVKIRPNDKFPQNTVNAQRLLLAASHKNPEFLVPLSQRMFATVWQHNGDLTDMPTLHRLASEVCGGPAVADELLAACSSQQIKDELKQNTDEAVSRGVFGVPSIFVETDPRDGPIMYFGSDRFHLICQQLGTTWHGPFPENKAKL